MPVLSTAFQRTAFQDNAFQIAVVAVSTTVLDPGSAIVGGHFSRGRWRDLKEELAAHRRHKLEDQNEAERRRFQTIADDLVVRVEKQRRWRETEDKRQTIARIEAVAEALLAQEECDNDHAMAMLLLAAEPDAEKRIRKAAKLPPPDSEDDEIALMLLLEK